MIRVTRIMQYDYLDAETAVADMSHWQVQGIRRFGTSPVIRSAVLPMEQIEEEWAEQEAEQA